MASKKLKESDINPMLRISYKNCRACGKFLPNTFEHFGSKNWGAKIRDPISGHVVCVPQTTNAVCKPCTSEAHRVRWIALRAKRNEIDEKMMQDAIDEGKRKAGLEVKPVGPDASNIARRENETELDLKKRVFRVAMGLALDGSEDHRLPRL
jgi:hypothetical protein